MANFGWAYVDCTDGSGAQAAGPTGSVQFITGNNATSGSATLVFHTASVYTYHPNTLVLSGNMIVTGAISASTYHIENIAIIDATGSTNFGNSDDDTHMRTGSLVVESVAATVIFSASVATKQTFIKGFVGNYVGNASSTHNLSASDHIMGCSMNSAQVVSIPSASICGAGAVYIIKDEVTSRSGASNRITLTGSPGGAQLFDGEGTYILTGTMPAISLYSNGTNWFVF
jgi:hypothetical protein